MNTAGTDMTVLLERLSAQTQQVHNMQIALWVLIGLIGLSVIVITLFIIPLLMQLKRTLKEAEIMSENINTEIMPKVGSMVSEIEPLVVKLTSMSDGIISSFQSVSTVIKLIRNIVGNRNIKQEA